MLKVTFLGTGTSQGIPVIACDCQVCLSENSKDKRLRASIMVEMESACIVVDTGPDFRQQMLRQHVRKLDAVLFTHQHKDHTAGLDDIRAFNFSQQKDMPIYGTQQVLRQIKKEFAYIFAQKRYPGVPEVAIHSISHEQTFEVSGIPILPIQVMHHEMPVLGFRIKNFTYITDANFISEKEIEKIYGTKILVVNALQKQEHISHFNLEQALAFAKRIGAEQTYLTHLSHRMGLHEVVSRELPPSVQIAYDDLELWISD